MRERRGRGSLPARRGPGRSFKLGGVVQQLWVCVLLASVLVHACGKDARQERYDGEAQRWRPAAMAVEAPFVVLGVLPPTAVEKNLRGSSARARVLTDFNKTEYPECDARMNWMLDNWDNVDWKEEYINNGVDGSRCSIQLYLSRFGGYCPAPSHHDCYDYGDCNARITWMVNNWDKVEWSSEYVEKGVNGTRCSIQTYLATYGKHCPPPTEEDCACGGPFPAEYPKCAERISWTKEHWGSNLTQHIADYGADGSVCSIGEYLGTVEGLCPPSSVCSDSYSSDGEWPECDLRADWLTQNWAKDEWYQSFLSRGVNGSRCSMLQVLGEDRICPHCLCTASMLSIQENHQYLDGGLKVGSVVVSLLLISFALALTGYTWVNRKTRIFVRSQTSMMLIFLTGSIVTLLSTLFIGNANVASIKSQAFQDFSCMAFYWFWAFGVSLTFSALIFKLYRIVRIFHNKRLRRRKITDSDLHKGVLAIISFDVVILIAWTIYSPLRWKQVVIAGAPLSTYGVCASEHAFGFQIALAVYQGFLFLLGAVLSYHTRNVDSDYQESRYISTSLVSQFQLYLIGIPIVFVFDEESFSSRFLVMWAVITSNALLLVLVMYIPKIIAIRSNKDRAASLNTFTKTARTGEPSRSSLDRRRSSSSLHSEGGSLRRASSFGSGVWDGSWRETADGKEQSAGVDTGDCSFKLIRASSSDCSLGCDSTKGDRASSGDCSLECNATKSDSAGSPGKEQKASSTPDSASTLASGEQPTLDSAGSNGAALLFQQPGQSHSSGGVFAQASNTAENEKSAFNQTVSIV